MARTCPRCGAVITDDASRFCTTCGGALEVAQQPQQPVNDQSMNYQQQQQPVNNQNMNYQQPQQGYNPNPGYQQPQQQYQQQNYGTEQKSKLVAGLLGLFLGAWGVHNFYLGNTGRGVAQIIVTIVTCGIGALWGLIEGIMILTGSINKDAKGIPLKD